LVENYLKKLEENYSETVMFKELLGSFKEFGIFLLINLIFCYK